MRVLWCVNLLMHDAEDIFEIKAVHLVPWIETLKDSLVQEENIKLCVATFARVNKLMQGKKNGITYYVIPKRMSDTKKIIITKQIAKEFSPDLIHIHGTEMGYGLYFQKALPKIPSCVSIQGFCCEYSKVYYAGMTFDNVFKIRGIRDIVKGFSIRAGKKDYYHRGLIEKKIIENTKNILGRTDWDRYNTAAINPDAQYHEAGEMMRSNFFREPWNVEEINRNQVFVTQGSYPIKGLHKLIEALALVMKSYPDTKLIVAGKKPFSDSAVTMFKIGGYGAYLKSLIKKHQLQNNIEFTGVLTGEQVYAHLKKSHVFVLPSVIENSPNSLVEAKIVGTPIVTACIGGINGMVSHNKTALIYPFTEINMLAGYIMKIFEDDLLASALSKEAAEEAARQYRDVDIKEQYISIYEKVIAICNKKGNV